MGRDKRNEKRTDQFTKWVRRETELTAFKALTSNAKVAYMHLKIRCFAETALKKKNVRNNNGDVRLSAKQLAKEMAVSEKTTSAALADLQAKGWIFCEQRGHLGVHGKAVAPRWRLTMMPTEKEGATLEPQNWKDGCDYPVIAYPKSKPKPRKGRSANFEKSRNPPPNWTTSHLQLGGGKPPTPL